MMCAATLEVSELEEIRTAKLAMSATVTVWMREREPFSTEKGNYKCIKPSLGIQF